jgi:hypothetical protein
VALSSWADRRGDRRGGRRGGGRGPRGGRRQTDEGTREEQQ